METANTGDMEIEILAIDVMEERKNDKKQALEEEICERWRALGAVGKLHNIVRCLRDWLGAGFIEGIICWQTNDIDHRLSL